MAEDLKTHKINLVIHTAPEWKSADVAEQVVDLLVMDNDDGGPFQEISGVSDPVNTDVDIQETIEGTLHLLDTYVGVLKGCVEDHKELELFRAGVEKLEHGVTDLQACLRCVEAFNSRPNVKVIKMGLDELLNAPEEVVHAVAHTMGLEQGTCEEMSKDDLIEWVKEKIKGEPRTIN